MIEMQAVKETIQGFVEEKAEQFVMEDLTDPAVLNGFSEAFAWISRELGEQFPRSSRAALDAGRLLQHYAENQEEPSDADLRSVEQTLSALQELSGKDIEEAKLEFPESFAPAGDALESSAGAGTRNELSSVVDLEILDEYLNQQESMLSELEDLVLTLEQETDPQALKELKRLLHTAKGESGVIGLNQVERVCHQVEDYIQEAETGGLQVDLLLEFKDWLEQSLAALKNKTEPPPADLLMAALKTAPEADDQKPLEASESGDVSGPDEAQPEPDQPDAADPQPAEKSSGTDAQKPPDEFAELLTPVTIEDPEITADFITETNEHFEISDENLLTLENDPENEESIASIFRAFHTIKGTTSFLGLTPISVLAHKAENLLDEVRKKHLAFDGLVVDATFNALDLLKTMIKQLEEALNAGEQFVPDAELPAVFAQLQKALSGESAAPQAVRETAPAAADEEPAAPDQETAEAQSPARNKSPAANGSSQAASGKTVKQTMKIDADRIDLLLETIGELVIVESIVSQEAAKRGNESRELERNLGQLTKITRSLQDMGMSMRLIPIDNTFRKMNRLVRDLAKKSGKKIELSMEGRETELDKGMVEKLGDPLVHMIRNAVDHGIEPTSDDRRAAGKDPSGHILLKAYHQGGNIHIDIRDDGRGLDKEVIIAKAIDRGLIKNADNMSDEEIFALIFEPGFSTAKQITDVSGRGVGMDVVKSNIESMRGNVRIASEKGKGSTFTLVLPLTMAIIDGMIVRVGSERYILPLLSIIESFQPELKMVSTVSGKGETVPFRQRLLPLFRLAGLFQIADAQTDPTQALVVVIEDAGRQIALLVDELLGQNQTVIKNLGQGLREVEGIAGASIMPDGTPGLIIDVNGLVKLASA